ncbi:MAG: hypothetical protein WCC94_12495 [Candidatus Bathyarchaeia archaeon]
MNFISTKKTGSNVMIARVKQMLAAEVGFKWVEALEGRLEKESVAAPCSIARRA